ncbi:MAG: alpha/beta hydrolase [Rhizobiales bacterium]|nr:alpha/beta hydrolase [Hyphomicrobiales bacterium]
MLTRPARRGVAFGRCAGRFYPGSGGRAVAICPAFGFEGLVARAATTRLAEMIAELGLPTLVFDYRGDGDSADIEGGPDLAGMIEDAQAAVAFLREAGARSVSLVGLRLGAAVAAAASTANEHVDDLALLAPVASGREHLRELRALAAMMERPGRGSDADAAIDVAGFALSHSLAASVEAFDLDIVSPAARARIYLAPERPRRRIGALSAMWASKGASITLEPFAGYDAMMCDATASRRPDAALEHAARWIAAGPALDGAVDPSSAPLFGAGWREETVSLDGGRLGAVLTLPGAPTRTALIALNAGRVAHTGWGRQTVGLARRLAQSGAATLRLDFEGVGDSPGEPHDLYGEAQGAMTRAAVDELAARGFERIGLFGLCSGAYHAFHVGMNDPRVDLVALGNIATFALRPTQTAELAVWGAVRRRAGGAIDETSEAAGALAELTPLAKRFAKSSLRALDSLIARAEAVAGRGAPLLRQADAFVARGGALHLIHAVGDPSVAEAEALLGPLIADGRAQRLFLAECDHEITPRAARETLAGYLAAAMAPAATRRVA